MIFSLSLRTRCATASSRGSAAVALVVAPPFDARLALELAERVRELLLFVVRRVVPLERLLLEGLRPDDEPPELAPEPVLLA
jgi:hypothetical protein